MVGVLRYLKCEHGADDHSEDARNHECEVSMQDMLRMDIGGSGGSCGCGGGGGEIAKVIRQYQIARGI